MANPWMDALLEQRRSVAQQVASALATQEVFTGILVFGSVAINCVDEYSDVDMLLICRPDIPAAAERAAMLQTLGSGWVAGGRSDNTLFAASDDGGKVDGIAVTLHYQSIAWIESVLHEVLEQGAITTHLMPFRPYTLPALLQRGWLLVDKGQQVTRWRMEIHPYPPLLKRNIVQHFMPVLVEQTEELLATAQRGLGPANFIFHLDHAVDALTSILYAINDLYDPAERRSAQTVWPLLEKKPVQFVERLTSILEGPFDAQGMMVQAQRYAALVQEALEFVDATMSSSSQQTIS